VPKSFAEAADLIGGIDIRLVDVLERTVRPVSFEPGRIEVALTGEAPPDLVGRLAATLKRATGAQWVVSIVADGGGATLREARASAEEQRRREAAELPLVRQVQARFPGAEVVAVRDLPAPQGAEPEADEADDEEDRSMSREA
jgi:DNA polymerase-3 subunit gamma/tau